ncbi:HNH endonuclease [Caulobacter segnis]|uniref:HNH endonuclease n=1 Tax=Caulobacter segnis TaxID=88688 RepID=UPI001CC009DF|nr:HNH endonuclease [Caulobacter segnis]UAL10200.1 HNH endonuclease [Caulobacter segnis]
MDDPETIEFDEPGARSHTPPGWPLETIALTPSGKAPKHYGDNVYRFGAAMTLSVLLPRRGWTLVKQTKTYAYLSPPSGVSGPPFEITVAVPPPEECLAIARRSYAQGQSWMGQLGEWPAWYLHERDKSMRRLYRDPASGAMLSEHLPQPPESSFSIGEWGVWQHKVTGIAGDFVTGFLPRGMVVGPPVDPWTPAQRLWEGEPKAVELTRYERSPAARRQCIEHFGPTCQACDLNYEVKYGSIGAELIHVHHLTPLAAIGEGYEVDPIRDLVPLCATCHHVVHSRTPPYSVEEIRAAIAGQLSDQGSPGLCEVSRPRPDVSS